MGLLDRLRTPVTEAAPSVSVGDHAAVANENELLRESLASLEQLAREDVGWRKLGMEQEQQFTRAGLLTIHAACLAANIKSPIIGRGLRIRRNYVWGQGVEIAARQMNDGDTTVNDVIQAFIDSPEYVRTLGSAQAREERESDLGNKGEFFILAIRTDDGVSPRIVPPAQIVDYITDAEDSTDTWFYKRTWSTNRVNLTDGRVERVTRSEWHPVLDYRPLSRDRVTSIAGFPVRWDQPIQHCAVNTLTEAPYGIPDAYAALDWARAYADFLTQWAVLMRALSRYAWRTTAPGSRAAKVKTAVAAAQDTVGGHAMMTPDATLEAIPKSGATIDSQSGKPLAGMAAAALDVPLTMLLADPGTTGARAVAETLDRPLELTTGARRNVWSDWIRALLDHVLLIAAESGGLQGSTIEQRGNRQRVVLADGQSPSIDVTWPPIEEMDPVKRMEAVKTADDIGLLPPQLVVRLMLEALGVEDVDEVLADMQDDDGNFVDPRVTSALDAMRRERDGAPGSQAQEAYR